MRPYWGSFVAIFLAFLGVCGYAAVGADARYADLSRATTDDASQAGRSETAAHDDCQCDCGCMGAYEPLWRARASVLAMKLSTPNSAVLVTDSYRAGGTELLNASEFGFKYEGGWEIALERSLNECWDVEARFFRIDGFSATRDPIISPTGSVVQYVTPLGNTAYPVATSGSYDSQLTNVELNARREINDTWSVVAGFRYLSLNESGLAIVQNINSGANIGTHNIRATNDLYGVQLGADANLWARDRLSVEGLLRAGIFSNHAANGVQITQTVGPEYASRSAADHTAFAGELGIAAKYQFTEHLALRGGYQLLWLEGVAQASDQVAVSDPSNGVANMSFKGSPFYDGVFLGLEFVR